jgi:amino acid transporter
MATQTISVQMAVLIIINIILGTGVFINSAMLIEKTGFLGGFLYPVAGLFFLPIVLGMARLVSYYQQGTFYTFGATLSPFWAVFTSLFYFVSKLASATLSITVFSRFLQYSIPYFAAVHFLSIASVIILLFVAFNMLNVRLGGIIQVGFVVMKMTPLLAVIGAGLYHYNMLVAVDPVLLWDGCTSGLPLLFFCFLGFESACSLTPIIENPQKNAARAIIIAFFSVLLLAFSFQTILYCVVGKSVIAGMTYTAVFPIFLTQTFSSFSTYLIPLFSLFIGCSALGGAYGILYSNMWNLYAIGKNNTFMGSTLITTCLSSGIPFYCIIAEGAGCFLYLIITQGAQLPLQMIATIGSVIVYGICMIVLFKHERSLLSCLGIFSTLLLLAISFYRFL